MCLEKSGQGDMVDVILRVARASDSVLSWHHVLTHITALFDESTPPSLNRAITFVSPYIPWHLPALNTENAVVRWAAAASTVPYSEEVGRSVAETLLRILEHDSLLEHIPINVWGLLKNRPSPSLVWRVRFNGCRVSVVGHVRGLGDIEILKSYLLLIFSEWNTFQFGPLLELKKSIMEDFCGIGMWCHRDDLVKHLDYVQRQLDHGLEHFKQQCPGICEGDIRGREVRYGWLKRWLLRAEGGAMKTLIRTPPRLILFNWRTNPCGCFQNPPLPSLALCPFRVRDFTFGCHFRPCSCNLSETQHNYSISQRLLFILVKLLCNSIWMLLCDSFYGTVGIVP